MSEFCSQHCGVCRANCELHRLKTGVEDLVGLLEADYVSQCDVCVDTAVQRESVEMRGVLESVGDELIPSTPLLCVNCLLYCHHGVDCDFMSVYKHTHATYTHTQWLHRYRWF